MDYEVWSMFATKSLLVRRSDGKKLEKGEGEMVVKSYRKIFKEMQLYPVIIECLGKGER